MFRTNGRPPQHSHSPNASEANVNHISQNVWPMGPMGPPQLNNPPQPVEIDPVSYRRAPSSFTPWEGTAYSAGYTGDQIPTLSNSVGHNKSSPVSLDFGPRSTPQDHFTSWYTGNDAPWVAKAALPELSQDVRIPPRGYRPSGYGSPQGVRYRPGNPSDNGSVHFGISSSDSGYGTGISLDSASVRGSDIMDQSQDNRSLFGRVPDVHSYRERRPTVAPRGTEAWPYNSPSTTSQRCPTCRKQVKTKSELKKHHLRHTKPFRCTNTSCTRTEGFSTVNDLNRHKQSKHPGDLSVEVQAKTFHCPVSGCKSPDKIWPRLDNFKSHLKRMHRLPDDRLDYFVHRGEIDPRINSDPQSQGASITSPRRLDQDSPLGLGSNDFPELSYPNEQPQWSNVSSSPLDRQTEITDSLLEDSDTQPLMLPIEDSPVSLEGGSGKPLSRRRSSRASWESDANDGCLERKIDLTSPDATSEIKSGPIIEPLSSSVGASEPADTLLRGKTPRPKKPSPIDPCLRNAIISGVFSAANPGKDDVLASACETPSGFGSPAAVHVSEILPCRTDSRTALPSQVVTSGNHVDDQDPCLRASSGSVSDETDLAGREAKFLKLLQVIKDAGYVLKKENRSQTGLGQTTDNLASGIHKKRDPVNCTQCQFHGRPCELKKHMKRHTRPYGCTFPKCQKAFGSKNDWKRHETSQHFQHETWRCDEKTNGVSCTKVFFRADDAREHLTKMHKITHSDTIEKKLSASRIGGNLQATYWCGFCRKIIKSTQKGDDGWTERFNHIDDHFMGRNGQTKQSVVHWKAPDGEEVQHSVSAQSQSSNDGAGSFDESPPTSSHNSATSSDAATTTVTPSQHTVPAQEKRKRADSDEQGVRSKKSRPGKFEIRIECCQCEVTLNPRLDTACPDDGHDISNCNRCRRRKIAVPNDDA